MKNTFSETLFQDVETLQQQNRMISMPLYYEQFS